MNRSQTLVSVALHTLIYLLLQVFFFREIPLFDTAFCFIYIAVLLMLPVEISSISAMFIGLALGLLTDSFYDTTGIHASACVLLAYVRKPILNLIIPSGGYDSGIKPHISHLGWRWFLTYSVSLVLLHHSTLFLIEASSIAHIGQTLVRIAASTGYTVVILILFQMLFYQS